MVNDEITEHRRETNPEYDPTNPYGGDYYPVAYYDEYGNAYDEWGNMLEPGYDMPATDVVYDDYNTAMTNAGNYVDELGNEYDAYGNLIPDVLEPEYLNLAQAGAAAPQFDAGLAYVCGIVTAGLGAFAYKKFASKKMTNATQFKQEFI